MLSLALMTFDSQTQSDLYSIITNTKLNNYESIVNARQSIIEYAENNNLSTDQLQKILEGLNYAEENLIFNVGK